MDVPHALPLEFLNLQEFGEASLDAIDEAHLVEPDCRESFVCEGVTTLNNNGDFGDNIDKCYSVTEALHCLRRRRLTVNPDASKESRMFPFLSRMLKQKSSMSLEIRVPEPILEY